MADEREDEELLLETPIEDDGEEQGAEDEGDAPAESGEDTQPASDDDDIEYVIGEVAESSGRGENSDLVKHLRQVTKEQARKLAELERQLPKAPPTEVGPEPQFDDYWDDPDKFKTDLLAWNERKRQAADEGKQQQQAQQRAEEEGKAVVQAYEGQKAALARPDYEDAEVAVFGKLGAEKVALLLQGSDNAAQVIHALHRFPDRLKALSEIANPAKFAFAAAKLEGQLKVMPKRKAPPPEEIARGNAAPGGGDRELARLEKEADKTGDRSALVAYRRKLRESGK